MQKGKANIPDFRSSRKIFYKGFQIKLEILDGEIHIKILNLGPPLQYQSNISYL